jgi:hypothetical protein
MAMLDTFRSSFFRIRDIARFFGVTAITARKWFEEDPGVVRVPSGRQRDRLYIPEDVMCARMRRMNIPEDTLERLVARQREVPGSATVALMEKRTPQKIRKPVVSEKRRGRARPRKRGAA